MTKKFLTPIFVPGLTIPTGAAVGKIWTSDVNGVGSWETPAVSGVSKKTITAIKTSAYTAAVNEVVRCDSTTAAFTVSLPATHAAGDEIVVKDVSGTADTNNITVDPADADTIDGASTYVLNVEKAAMQFISDGTNWMVV